MTFYADMAATATELLTEFGQAGTVTRTTITGGGPADPTGGTASTTDYAAQMAVFPVTDDRIDGTNIKAGDFQVICEATDVELTADDRITASFGGVSLDLTIVRLGRIAPAGVTVAYDVVCRGG